MDELELANFFAAKKIIEELKAENKALKSSIKISKMNISALIDSLIKTENYIKILDNKIMDKDRDFKISEDDRKLLENFLHKLILRKDFFGKRYRKIIRNFLIEYDD